MYRTPSMLERSVSAAQAILWCSRETRMMATLVVGEKYLMVREGATAPQPTSPKCVSTLWRSAAQIVLPSKLLLFAGVRGRLMLLVTGEVVCV